MGHIYSPDELARGAIPTSAHYDTAMRSLRERLRELVNERILYGAVLLGSVTYADFELGSDIDFFAVTESHRGEHVLRDLTIAITDSTHVHFDMKTVTREAAQTGLHRLLYYYVHTIRKFSGQWTIGSDPAEIVADRQSWQDVQGELMEDLLARVDSLVKARLHTRPDFGSSHCSLLDRIVTLPVYAAIGMVRLKHRGHPIQNGRRLSKVETCRLYAEMIPGQPTEMLLDILRRKQEYRNALRSLPIEPDAYRELLRSIDAAYPLACAVIEESASYLHAHRIAP